MKQIIIISIFIISCGFVKAQDIKNWSLEECIQYAIDHNITIQQLKLETDAADVDLNTSRMSRLPNLNAGLSQNFNFGRAPKDNGAYDDEYENRTTSNTSFNLNSSTPIFTGFRIPNEIERNKLNLEAAVQNMEKAKEDLALNVASLYLKVLFNKELLKVSEEQLSLSRSQVQRTEYLVEVGKVPASQLYDIKAQVAKDEVSVVEADNNLKIAVLDLAQALELEQATSFDIQDPPEDIILEELYSSVQPVDVVYNHAVAFKPVIKEQEYRLESSKKSVKIAQAGYLPSLNLNLSYSNSYYHDYDKGSISFSSQIRQKGSESIGLSMSIPIFNRFQVRNQVRTARINTMNRELTLENTKKALYKDIQTAYLNAVASQKKYFSSTKAVDASKESFRYAQERYEIGKSTVFEFNEAKTKLVQSQSELIQAKYDYIFTVKILDFYNGNPITL